VRRQGLEPRTVALRVLEERSPDLGRSASTCCELGICLPQLSAGDQGLPIDRGPSTAHARGVAGENEAGSGLAVTVQLDRRVRRSSLIRCLVGKRQGRGSSDYRSHPAGRLRITSRVGFA
jgi:hypothetical protein